MVSRILVRSYTPGLEVLRGRIASLVAAAGFETVEIDHSNLTLADFDLGGARPVSIDRHLASRLDAPYLQVSRVFRLDGTVACRLLGNPALLNLEPGPVCVVDTDRVKGEALALAGRALGTTRYSTPITVGPGEDLVDVEDLLFDQSLFEDGTQRSYLCNPVFFTRRTSLPGTLFEPVRDAVRGQAEAAQKPVSSRLFAI